MGEPQLQGSVSAPGEGYKLNFTQVFIKLLNQEPRTQILSSILPITSFKLKLEKCAMQLKKLFYKKV